VFIIHLRDGRTLKESDGVNWRDVPLHEITSLQLHRNGKFYTVSVDGANVKLLQLKRGTVGTLINEEVSERVIGFIWQDKVAVKMEVDEKTGNVRLTLEVRDEKGKWRRL
jgi:hypothetical protein